MGYDKYGLQNWVSLSHTLLRFKSFSDWKLVNLAIWIIVTSVVIVALPTQKQTLMLVS
ncbi:hypothetical protein AtEden1_Chr5g0109881 [Arabidopsis thaliana]